MSKAKELLMQAGTNDPTSAFNIAFNFIRALGPVTKGQIEYELHTQCLSAQSWTDAAQQAEEVIKEGLARGWIEFYDEDSYDVSQKGIDENP